MFLTKLGIILNSEGFNNNEDHSKLSTFRLWLPESMIFFTFFCSNTTSISFVQLFVLSSFRWFIHGGIIFVFWSLLGTRTPTTNTNQQHNDVFLYIRKTTFYTSLMDVLINIGDHSKSCTLRLWLPVSTMSFSYFVLTQCLFLLFIHSYCHHFGGSFMVELCFFWCLYVTVVVACVNDVFFYLFNHNVYFFCSFVLIVIILVVHLC
jgi:hypothetical protein